MRLLRYDPVYPGVAYRGTCPCTEGSVEPGLATTGLATTGAADFGSAGARMAMVFSIPVVRGPCGFINTIAQFSSVTLLTDFTVAGRNSWF
jgi:hypothetical protein